MEPFFLIEKGSISFNEMIVHPTFVKKVNAKNLTDCLKSKRYFFCLSNCFFFHLTFFHGVLDYENSQDVLKVTR
jgi:hypothetical protein